MFFDEVIELVDEQYGLAADHQLIDLVPDPAERADTVRALGLRRITSRVRGRPVHGTGPGHGRELTLRVLDSGRNAVLWGKTAVAWWGLQRFRLTPVHVARRRVGTRPPVGATLHQLVSLDPRDVTSHRGVPIVRPEAAVLWLAGMWTHRLPGGAEAAFARLETVLDDAWREGLIDGEYLHALARRSGGKGRSGIVAMRRALETRPPDYLPPGSGTEARFEEVLPYEVRRRLRRQVRIADSADLIGIVDYECTEWPLVVEINGEQWHTSRSDRARDERRYADLLASGRSVLVLWQYDVWHEPQRVREILTRLLKCPDRAPTLHRPTPAPWML